MLTFLFFITVVYSAHIKTPSSLKRDEGAMLRGTTLFFVKDKLFAAFNGARRHSLLTEIFQFSRTAPK